jgi:hypothetical protein
LGSALALATAVGVAAALAFATVRAFLAAAAALAFATVFAGAIVLARRGARGGRARRVRAVLRVASHCGTSHQSGDGRCDEKSSLGSGHIFRLVLVYPGIHAQNHLRAGMKSVSQLILEVRYSIRQFVQAYF